jgi:hypothetical protein
VGRRREKSLSLSAALAAAVFLGATLGFGGSVGLALVSGSRETDRAAALARAVTVAKQRTDDQFCLLAERQQRENIRALVGTYRYLKALKPDEADATLTAFILRQLPQTEARAVKNAAPDVCRRTGYGLASIPRIPSQRPSLPSFLGPLPPPPAALAPSSAPVRPPEFSPAPRPDRAPTPPQRPEDKPQTPSRPIPAPSPPKSEPAPLTEPPAAPDVTKPPSQVVPPVCVTVPQAAVCTPEL